MPPAFTNFIGKSRAIKLLQDWLFLAAQSTAPVLLVGEPGTGKEMCARAIHDRRYGSQSQFLTVNCATLSPLMITPEFLGQGELPSGTLFLDEIGELEPIVQARLVRQIKDMSYAEHPGRRLICSSSLPLEPLVETGRFRSDLFYTLQITVLTLPPLRDRPEDIPDLAHHFLEQANKQEHKKFGGFSPDAAAMLTAFPWPGNAQQLKNIIRRIAIFNSGSVISQTMVADVLHPLPLSRKFPRWFEESLQKKPAKPTKAPLGAKA